METEFSLRFAQRAGAAEQLRLTLKEFYDRMDVGFLKL
jgi:hypothetical protein